MPATSLAVWSIALASVAAMIMRPARIPEWIWPVLGAATVVASGLLPGAQAAAAALDGIDVYAFLAGMLALAELARVHSLFDIFAGALIARAKLSAPRLFDWVFLLAIVTTVLLSNDGTILLLTPAALAIVRTCRVKPMPYLYAVALVANAASFVLPISNPANLVVFSPLPKLFTWLAVFAMPSLAALLSTYIVMRVFFRHDLRERVEATQQRRECTRAASITLVCVAVSVTLLVAVAAVGGPVGYTAFGLALVSMVIVSLVERAGALRVLREGPWSIIPLVAGLFVLMAAIDRTGALRAARRLFESASHLAPAAGVLATGWAVAVLDSLINNLPAGVFVRYALRGSAAAPHITHAALIGIDLGPNLSVGASLATLLWLMLLRREGIKASAWHFLGLGALVTIPSLTLTLIALH